MSAVSHRLDGEPPVPPDHDFAACDRARGASLRAPLNHPSRKVNYDVLGLDRTIGDAISKLDKLLMHLNHDDLSDVDPVTTREVSHLRRYLREAAAQVVHVIEANHVWSDRAAHADCPAVRDVT